MSSRISNYTRGHRQGTSADNFPACESRPRRGMPSASNAVRARRTSPEVHITDEQAGVERVLAVAKPVEGILEAVFLDPETARIQIADRHRRVHVAERIGLHVDIEIARGHADVFVAFDPFDTNVAGTDA